MLSTTLAILLVATWAAVFTAWLKRLPTAHICPRCMAGTETIVAPLWLRPTSKWLALRWCAACEWQGIGRNGPDYIPGRQIAHDSGFHWGADEIGENMGFQWRQEEELPPLAEPPAHRSGFRFGASNAPEDEASKAHPSGFAWGGQESQEAIERRRPDDDPSGFAWRRRRSDAPAGPSGPPHPKGFEWKATPKSETPDDDEPGPFKWGGVA